MAHPNPLLKDSPGRFPWKQANPPDNKVLHSVPIRHTRSLRVHNRPIPISSKTWLTLPILCALYTSHQENLAPTEPHNVTGPGTRHLPFITLLTPGACFQSCFQVLLALSGQGLSGLYTSHQENLAITQPHNVTGPGHNQLYFIFYARQPVACSESDLYWPCLGTQSLPPPLINKT